MDNKKDPMTNYGVRLPRRYKPMVEGITITLIIVGSILGIGYCSEKIKQSLGIEDLEPAWPKPRDTK